MSSSAVHQDRLAQGAAAVFTVREAARLLGWKGAEAWIRRQGLAVRVDGVERVIWGDLLDRARERQEDQGRRVDAPQRAHNRPKTWEEEPLAVLRRFSSEP